MKPMGIYLVRFFQAMASDLLSSGALKYFSKLLDMSVHNLHYLCQHITVFCQPSTWQYQV